LPLAALTLTVLGAVAAGRWIGSRSTAAVPLAIGFGVGGAIALALPDVIEAGGSPTGYANANADLAAVAALAALATIQLLGTRGLRSAAAALAALLAVSVVATGSVAGTVFFAVAGLLALASTQPLGRTAAVAGGAVVVCLLLGITIAVSHGSDMGGLEERAGERADLWAAAADQAAASPFRGNGPSSYEQAATVSDDEDLRWAHHEYLQTAAEEGLIGLLLLLAVVACAYLRLLVAPSHARAVIGATVLTVVAAHATVDHVLHHAAVPITLAVLVGWATADPPDLGTRGSPHLRP
jgi:O-antigen ligase